MNKFLIIITVLFLQSIDFSVVAQSYEFITDYPTIRNNMSYSDGIGWKIRKVKTTDKELTILFQVDVSSGSSLKSEISGMSRLMCLCEWNEDIRNVITQGWRDYYSYDVKNYWTKIRLAVPDVAWVQNIQVPTLNDVQVTYWSSFSQKYTITDIKSKLPLVVEVVFKPIPRGIEEITIIDYFEGNRFEGIKIKNPVKIGGSGVSNSGTGFAITANGLLVTNHHVIDGAKTIKVRGINSDFNKTYKAKVLVSDKNNDLALLQIDDYGFTSLGTIPYTIKTGLAGVGESIFVLGYPLRATMGDEIKLTNGIVSSRTGFQGDITSYQISAPVQSGNSGGPLFDSEGNLVGIINAKHVGAENASYAVKASYLSNLVDFLPSPPKLQKVNSLTGKTLTQQVELVKKFVYIIETE